MNMNLDSQKLNDS